MDFWGQITFFKIYSHRLKSLVSLKNARAEGLYYSYLGRANQLEYLNMQFFLDRIKFQNLKNY